MGGKLTRIGTALLTKHTMRLYKWQHYVFGHRRRTNNGTAMLYIITVWHLLLGTGELGWKASEGVPIHMGYSANQGDIKINSCCYMTPGLSKDIQHHERHHTLSSLWVVNQQIRHQARRKVGSQSGDKRSSRTHIYLHLFTKLFHKDLSSIVRRNTDFSSAA